MNEMRAHRFDLLLEINVRVSFKCKHRISHHRTKQGLNIFRIKWCLSSYFSLPAKLLLFQSRIFTPIRAPPGRFDNIVQSHKQTVFYTSTAVRRRYYNRINMNKSGANSRWRQ